MVVVASLATVAAADHRGAAPAPNPTLAEIQKTFGFVPDFIKGVLDALLPAFWGAVTGLEMNPATRLDGTRRSACSCRRERSGWYGG